MMRALVALFTLCAAWTMAPPANALVCSILGCSCNVSAAPLDFHNISPLEGAQDSETEVTIDCTGLAELFPSMLVSAAGGTNGTISARKMKSSAGYFLDYNLYTTVGRNVIWGNGTTGLPVNVSGGLLGLGHWQVSRTVYGRVTPTIATRPGTYTDTIVIRIDW